MEPLEQKSIVFFPMPPFENEMRIELGRGYAADFERFEKDVWDAQVNLFQDANLYQTWSYDMVRTGRVSVAHMILRKENSVVGAAQARLYRIPIIRTGIVYVFWGPLWKAKGVPVDNEVFRQAVRALRNEYSLRRGFVLRIYPQSFRFKDESCEKILGDEGYRPFDDEKTHRTLLIDLEPPLEELRSALNQKWRNCLNRAEKNGLELILGEDEGLFDEFDKMYDEMARRKELSELADLNHLKLVQRDLPPTHKLKVILCRLNGELCAGAIFSAIGNSGVYMCGATSNTGMKTNGSYLIQWTFLKWLKENGFRYYDLNGINPDRNPGTYHFKHGLAGKRGNDVEFLGKYQVADSLLNSVLVTGAEWLMRGYRRMAQAGRSLRNSSNKL